MTEQTKGIIAAVTILGCFALLGFCVHERVDGAGVAAVAVVTTLVAWFARQPSKGDPPTGASVVPLVGAGLIIAELVGCTPEEAKAALATQTFEEEQRDCLRQYEACEERVACRRVVNAKWGKAWDAKDLCAKDGGQ